MTVDPSEQEVPILDDTIRELEATIRDRMAHPREGSYTCQLIAAGQNRILKKVGEEAAEVLVAAALEGDERLASETADLVYHILVLLASRGQEWNDVVQELRARFR